MDMKYAVYVIYSPKFNRIYKGHTNDIETRLKQHNSGAVRSTRPFIPWIIIYTEAFKTKAEAISREKYFKSAAGRRYLKDKLPLK